MNSRRRANPRRRFLHPLWLLVSLPGYVGWRLLPALCGGPVGIAVGSAVLLAACAIIPLSVNLRALPDRRFADALAWLGFGALGFFSTLFVATAMRDVFLACVHLLAGAPQAAALATPSARWTVVLTAASALIGLLIARHPRLVQVDVAIENLPPALSGFTIAQITDVHVGPTIKRDFLSRIVSRVNALDADMIAITGDLVDGSVADLSAHTAPLAELTAPCGVFFVTGNHEYYSGEPDWTAELRRLGITVLKNQHLKVHHRGAVFVLAGVTDFTAHHYDPTQRSDPQGALEGAAADTRPRILLAHQPNTAPAAAAAGYDLQISGHTHGGQFWPWNLAVGLFQPFTTGLNRLADLQVYVSRGTGYWGPPNRFIVPGEITRLRLVPAS